MDKYTKVVLTLIAIALWANLAVSVAPGRGLIRDANAQQLSRVVIAGVETGAPLQVLVQNPIVTVKPAGSMPVYLTNDAAGSAPAVVQVNLAQIGSKSFQQGVVLPVDIEGIAGAAVKSSGGLPVTVGQPVMVSARDPLPVTAKDPMQVVVTRLPPPGAQGRVQTPTQTSVTNSAPPGQ